LTIPVLWHDFDNDCDFLSRLGCKSIVATYAIRTGSWEINKRRNRSREEAEEIIMKILEMHVADAVVISSNSACCKVDTLTHANF
jgi:hypothetical protein